MFSKFYLKTKSYCIGNLWIWFRFKITQTFPNLTSTTLSSSHSYNFVKSPEIDFVSFPLQPQQVLDEYIHVVKAFISLTMNSTKQLSHLQLGGKLVIRNGMNGIIRLANVLVQQHLPRILNEMKVRVKNP